MSQKITHLTDNHSSNTGHRQRLRNRFVNSGLNSLADYEIIELILTLAIPRSDVKKPAKLLISRFSSLKAILDAPDDELKKIPGIGAVTPVALKIIKATATLYLQQSSEKQNALIDPDQIMAFWRLRIGNMSNEVFEVGYLDSSYHLLHDGVETMSIGTIDRTTVYPRRIIESALRKGAYAIILAHNHPNGSSNPSEQDKLLTRAIILAAETVEIRVVDHLIITMDDCFSFRKASML
jgi:DNA repair protein RadC